MKIAVVSCHFSDAFQEISHLWQPKSNPIKQNMSVYLQFNSLCLCVSSCYPDGHAAEAPGVCQLHRVSRAGGLSGSHSAGYTLRITRDCQSSYGNMDSLLRLTQRVRSQWDFKDLIINFTVCSMSSYKAKCKGSTERERVIMDEGFTLPCYQNY